MDDLLIAGSPVAAEAKGEDAAAVAILILLPAIPTEPGRPRAVRPGFLRGGISEGPYKRGGVGRGVGGREGREKESGWACGWVGRAG